MDDRGGNNKWFIFYTSPRAEKAVNQRLIRQGYTTFLPLYLSKRIWKDRKKTIEVPLFSSYIFVWLSSERLNDVLKTPGIVKAVYDQGSFAVITETEVERIKSFLVMSEGYRISVEKGDVVTINKGPLAGKTGEIVRVGRDKILLYIKQLSLGVTAEIDRTDIETFAV